MRRSGWKVIVWLAITIPLVTCFGSAFFSGQVLAYRDAAHFYYPLEHWLAERWGQREIPLWNSQDGNGVPVVAEATSAVFYPGKLIFALPLAFSRRFVLYVVVHFVWAACGAYMLVRDGIRIQAAKGRIMPGQSGRRGSSSAARATARICLAPGLSAVAYTFGGAVLFQYSNVVFLVGAAWLPWTLWALRRMLDRAPMAMAAGRLRLPGPDCFGWRCPDGLPCRTGRGLLWPAEAQTQRCRTVISRRGWSEPGAVAARHSAGWSRPAMLGVLLAAVQVLPTWHWTANSDRVLYSYPRTIYEIRPFMARPSQIPIRAATEGRADVPQGWAGAVSRPASGPPEPARTSRADLRLQCRSLAVDRMRVAQRLGTDLSREPTLAHRHRRRGPNLDSLAVLWHSAVARGLRCLEFAKQLGHGSLAFVAGPAGAGGQSWIVRRGASGEDSLQPLPGEHRLDADRKCSRRIVLVDGGAVAGPRSVPISGQAAGDRDVGRRGLAGLGWQHQLGTHA